MIHQTDKGHAIYWLTRDDGMVIYKIIYADGSEPLYTNDLKTVEQKLKSDGQQRLF
jgi:hypothetical protein